MGEKTFYMWLRQQRWRSDEIGDLARDIWQDRQNIRDHSPNGIRFHMIAAGAYDGALSALNAAAAEYYGLELDDEDDDMPDATWKQVERAVAERLNGKRQGATGRTGPDVVGSWFVAEIKHRRRLPQWLKDASAQANGCAGGRLPLVILHEAGQRHDNDLVMMRLADFENWFGDEVSDATAG